MLRFFKEAFFFRLPTRWFGDVPANMLFVAAMAALGLGHPGFWLLGLGLELSYLGFVGSNPRFQQLILQRARVLRRESTLTRLERVLGQLAGLTDPTVALSGTLAGIPRLNLPVTTCGAPGRHLALARYNVLAERVAAILERYRIDRVDDQVVRSNQESLHTLLLVYAELLYGQAKLAHLGAAGPGLHAEIEALRTSLQDESLPREIAESRRATLDTLERRVATREKRASLEARISTDLQRVEQQVELAWEATLVSGEIGRINTDLNIATMLMSDEFDLSPLPSTAATERRRSAPRRSESA